MPATATTSATSAIFRFRVVMAGFICGLVLSGVTAFPLLAELRLLVHLLRLDGAVSAAGHSGVAYWLLTVRFDRGVSHCFRT